MADATDAGVAAGSTTSSAAALPVCHRVQIRHHIGSLEIDVDFRLTGQWTILFGPSGSGKSTILRAIAGLLRPDRGSVLRAFGEGTDGERKITLADSAARVFVPAHRRGVRLAPQTPALFPHLTVKQNLTYGRDLCRASSDSPNEPIEALMSAFQIVGLAAKLPSALSGGEAQRVNLARAFSAGGASLLLLDEPFTGLDRKLRDSILKNLIERRQNSVARQILSVTHDVGEAFQLGAEVIKLADGKVVAQGPPGVVLAEERDDLLAELNLSEARESRA